MIGENQNKKKKDNALKATMEMEEEVDDVDMMLLTRKFKRFLNTKSIERKWGSSNQKGGDMTCFKYKNSGHIRAACPFLDKDKFKIKEKVKATWDDLDTSGTKMIPTKKKSHLYVS